MSSLAVSLVKAVSLVEAVSVAFVVVLLVWIELSSSLDTSCEVVVSVETEREKGINHNDYYYHH